METVNKLFLPYELAVIAKQKGFSEPCFAYYDPKKNLTVDSAFNYNQRECEVNRNGIQAPLYAQIVNWLRNNHNLHIEIVFSDKPDKFYYYIGNISSGKMWRGDDTSYENGLTKAIEQAFKLI